MATLDDKILGEKLEYYCSSSEDEEELFTKDPKETASQPPPPSQPWNGQSTNTGPKGVLQDWQRFKQLETEQRKEDERERIALAKRLAVTCTSHRDDEREKEKERQNEEQDEDDILMDEVFFKQYLQQRMEEMIMSNNTNRRTFGKLISLESADLFLDAVDKEDTSVTIIIHIFDELAAGCEAMNGCLMCLAQEYPHVKFCRFLAKDAGVTDKFKLKGLPALLVYKGGNLVGNFVKLLDEFGDDFYASDVESFLIEHGMIIDKTLIPPSIRDSSLMHPLNDDSDNSIDD